MRGVAEGALLNVCHVVQSSICESEVVAVRMGGRASVGCSCLLVDQGLTFKAVGEPSMRATLFSWL